MRRMVHQTTRGAVHNRLLLYGIMGCMCTRPYTDYGPFLMKAAGIELQGATAFWGWFRRGCGGCMLMTVLVGSLVIYVQRTCGC